MNEPTQRNILDLIQDKSALVITSLPHSQRVTLKMRIQQIEGMIEVLQHLPECTGLIEPLQHHHQWLKAKLKAWPI